MIDQPDTHSKDNNVETEQGNQVTYQQINETTQSVTKANSATANEDNINNEQQNDSNKVVDCTSGVGEKSTEEPSSQIVNSWNAVNAVVDDQKAQIKGKDGKNEEESEFKFFEELSKRFVEQQDQVIDQRKHLLIWFAWITATQLLVINVLIFFCIFGNKEILDITLGFMKFFVGATFLELLGGLLIIVKFVFSHETFDMLKHLTYVEPPAKD